MKIILRQSVERLGEAGEVVTVKDGYARNYLIPKQLAYPATPSYIKMLEEERRQKQHRLQKEKRMAEELAEKLKKVSVTIPVRVGEEDRMFGSVTTQDIAAALKEQGYDIDRRKILLDEPIKELGIYPVSIKLHPEVEASIKVWVVKE
ncbi:MAG: 50S ribosomal protein L9 [Calditrichaeota bacterium]|nr:MAG: 50S ribosomal protein L9 [Calditrichota bacterium]